MTQNQSTSTKVAIKTPTTLETVPEDVAAMIAESIESWTNVEGSLGQRDKARRSRDSALRALTLSCHKSHDLFLGHLVQNVTLTIEHIISFAVFLKNNTHYGQSVKSIRFEEIRPLREKEKQTLGFQLASMSQLPVHSEDATDRSIDGAFEVAGYLYFKLVSLQTLTINQSILIPRKFRQLRCFESSLKKVWIALVDHSRPEVGTPLNAKNVIWLLGFGVIHEASFGFTCSYDDSNFLEEHHSAFAKISKVKKLSLRIRFVFEKSNKRTWWELPTRERRREYQKTTAVKMILGITNGLECCEVLPSYQGEKNPGDFTQMDLNCFAGLTSSFKTLQHLRILGVPTPIFNDYRLFNCLRTLSVDSEILQALSQDHSLQLPDTLERIILTYYQVPTIATWSFKEDTYLVQLLKAQPIQSLPNFKEVVVPLVAIDPNGNLIKDRSNLRIWSERRKELESEAIFKSGRVTMRKCGPGQNVEGTAAFMSTLRWISPY